MPNKGLPTGAYIITNKKHPKVLHIAEADIAHVTQSAVGLKDRDENTYPEQQIWWVERTPECADPDDPTYSITNTVSGKSLGRKEPEVLLVSQSNGAAWQKWRLYEPAKEHLEEGRNWYQIVDYSRTYSIDSDCIASGVEVVMRRRNLTDSAHSWEFVVPQTKFPFGWFQIGNAKTGVTLSHKYLTSLPHATHVQKKDACYCRLSMGRESWGTQWTISRYARHCVETLDEKEDTAWIVQNRLTGGRLGLDDFPDCVIAEQGDVSIKVTASKGWILEFQSGETFWRIRNKGNSCYLKQTDELEGGTGLACVDKSYRQWPMDQNKKWWFRTVYDHPCGK